MVKIDEKLQGAEKFTIIILSQGGSVFKLFIRELLSV